MAAGGAQNKHRRVGSAGRGDGFVRGLWRVEVDDLRPVPAGGDKAQEIGGAMAAGQCAATGLAEWLVG